MAAFAPRVIGTAGHIDHGKTSLVRALTGIDTDRLKEEKERGITIELGFAHLDLGAEGIPDPVGVVDVPGHERFIRAMVAGAVGIDVVVLVVAADEGVMPQTREHLDVCRLLDLRRGVVALTKADLVDPELRELAKTLGFIVVHTFTQKRSGFDTTAYLGEGKRQEIRYFVNRETPLEDESDDDQSSTRDEAKNTINTGAKDVVTASPEQPIEIIFVDHEISPSQARNLEKEVGCQVMDRTMVILEIFHRHARSRAARFRRRPSASSRTARRSPLRSRGASARRVSTSSASACTASRRRPTTS